MHAPVRPRPDDALALLAWGVQRDPIGDRAHAALVALALLALPLGTTTFAILFGIALGYSLLRLWATGPAVGYLLFRIPLVGVLAALLAWTCLSALWSADRSQAWDEIAILRFQVPMLILLWPVIERWRAFVIALSLGVGLASLIQVGQFALGESWPLALWWHGERIAGRDPGMLHPNSTAVLALAALFLLPHLAIARPSRWGIALLLWPPALLSLMLTGSRGCWIAALAGLIAATPQIGCVVRGIKRARATPKELRPDVKPSERRARRMVAAILTIVVLALATLLAPGIFQRVSSGVSEVRAAIEARDYTSDTAARWRQIEISVALFRAHPLTGVGAGGYHAAARSYVRAEEAQRDQTGASGDRPRSTGLLPHPHSALLYFGAVLGLPGILLFAAFWALVFRSERLAARRAASGLFFMPAITAILIAFILDAHNLSAPGTIALMLIVAIILSRRCAERDDPARGDADASKSCIS